MTNHPTIVVEYTQYSDTNSFQPLELQCAVNNLVKTESIHSKLITIVRYWIKYKQGDARAVLSFGLGEDVIVNSIISIPTLRQWSGIFDFRENNAVTRSMYKTFPLHSDPIKQGLPQNISFEAANFTRLIQGGDGSTIVLLKNLKIAALRHQLTFLLSLVVVLIFV